MAYLDTKIYREHVREELGSRRLPTVVLQLGNFSSYAKADLVRYKLQLSPPEPPLPRDGALEAGADTPAAATPGVPPSPLVVSADKVTAWIHAVQAGQIPAEDDADLVEDEEEEEDEEGAEEEEVEQLGLVGSGTVDGALASESRGRGADASASLRNAQAQADGSPGGGALNSASDGAAAVPRIAATRPGRLEL